MEQNEFDELLRRSHEARKPWGEVMNATMQALSVFAGALARQTNASQLHALLQAQIKAAEARGQLSETAQMLALDILATLHAESIHQNAPDQPRPH